MGDNTGLGIWFKDGVINILSSANEASASTALAAADFGGDAEMMRAWRRGYKAALVTVALAFGIRPQNINLPATKAIREPTRLEAPDKST